MSREILRLYDEIPVSVNRLSLEVERAEVQIVHEPFVNDIVLFANRPGHWAVLEDGQIRQIEAQPHRLYHVVVDSLPCEVESFFQWFWRKLSWRKKSSADFVSASGDEERLVADTELADAGETAFGVELEASESKVEPAFVIDRLEIRVPVSYRGGLRLDIEEGSLTLDFWRGGNFTLNGSGYTVVTGGDVSEVETLHIDLAGEIEVSLGSLEVEKVEFTLDDNSSIKADSCKCETAQIIQVDGEGSVIIPNFEASQELSCSLQGEGEFNFGKSVSAGQLQVTQAGSSTFTTGSVVVGDFFHCFLEDDAVLQVEKLETGKFACRQDDNAELILGVVNTTGFVKMQLFYESALAVKSLTATSNFCLEHDSGGEARIGRLTTESDVELTLSGEGDFSGDELVCRNYLGQQQSSGEIKLEKLCTRASLTFILEDEGGFDVTTINASSVKVIQKCTGEVEVNSLTASKEVLFDVRDEGGFNLKKLECESFTLELPGGAEVEVGDLQALVAVSIFSTDCGEISLGKVKSASFKARHSDGGSLNVMELHTEELTLENSGSTEINIKNGATAGGVVINEDDGNITLGQGFTSVRVRAAGEGEVTIGW
jgi:hypothetical protein